MLSAGTHQSGERLPLPKYHELLWPTLKAVEAVGGSATIQEIAEKVAELQQFSEEQQSVSHGDGPQSEIEYRLAWARTYLKAVGALDNSTRGVWSVTEKGRALRQEDMASIPAQVRARLQSRPPIRRQTVEPEENLTEATTTADWKEGLLDILRQLPPDRFERLAQRLLREAGFISVTVTGRSGDGGIDGIGVYGLSLVSFPIFFQTKRYRGSVGASAVRDFRGAMTGRGDKGLLITTGTFTSDAKQEATREGAPPIDLIDGQQLCELLKRYSLGVSTTPRTVEEIQTDGVFFESI